MTPEQQKEHDAYNDAIQKQKTALGIEGKAESVVYHGHGVYQAGDQNIRLEETEQWVLEALVEARAASKDELIRKSGVDDAVRVLKRIKQKHPALGKVIHFPGGKGRGGYSTSIQAVGGE